MDPTFALHRLEQDRARIRSDRLFERVDVAEPGEARRGSKRLERRALRRLTRYGESTVRPAVERVLERDHASLPGRLVRELERRLDRLRTGVAEERARAAEALREQ